MSVCLIFGGAGFVGTHLAEFFLENQIFSKIHLADIQSSTLAAQPGIYSGITDIRQPIPTDLLQESPDWIVHLAAIHREPGHQDHEYFETNVNGTKHVIEFAERVGCSNIFFASSLAVYGMTLQPANESSPLAPITAYGQSKSTAENLLLAWHQETGQRRLIISRPAVLYGPRDPGNILRMIKAIKTRYFVFPGSPKVKKSYGYIYGFLNSILFTMNRPERLLIYNYSETPTQSMGELGAIIRQKFDTALPMLSLPSGFLTSIAFLISPFVGKEHPIHPTRVRKAGTPTHIIPQVLLDFKFPFVFDFKKSLDHWLAKSPRDFD